MTLAFAASPAAAQQGQGEQDGQDGQGRQLDAPLVDVSHGRQAHSLVEQWVRKGAVPESTEADPIRVSGLLGLRVTLRLDGLTLAESDAVRIDAAMAVDEPGASLDLVPLLRRATTDALESARQRLEQAHLQALRRRRNTAGNGAARNTETQNGNATNGGDDQAENEADNEAPAPPELVDVAHRIVVDVQLAHDTETVAVSPDAPRHAVMDTFAPGYHGLRSPAPNGRASDAAMVWPATALARHYLPEAQVGRLLRDRGRDADAIAQLGRQPALKLQRFKVIHVVRPQPDMPIVQLVRGNVVLPPQGISSRTLDGMVSRLAQHLQGRITTDHVVRGTYYPTSDRYDPPVAPVREAGLVSYALMRHASHRRELVGGEAPDVRKLADKARAAAVLLGEDLIEQPKAAHPAATALVLMTLLDDIEPGAHKALRDMLIEQLLKMHDAENGGFITLDQQNEPRPATPASSAAATAALASAYAQTRDEQVGAIVRQEMQRIWTGSEQNPDIASLMWFVLAHHKAGELLAGDDAAAQQRLAQREQGLRRLVHRLLEQQVDSEPTLGPADVMGGFELEAAAAGAPPRPDWRTAQLMAFLALCVREDDIAPDEEALGWVLDAALAGRYIAQLMMNEPSAYYVRSMSDTLGGVRVSLWNNRMDVGATAMSLLACVQLQETLDHFSPSAGD